MVQLQRMFAERESEEFDFVIDLLAVSIVWWNG